MRIQASVRPSSTPAGAHLTWGYRPDPRTWSLEDGEVREKRPGKAALRGADVRQSAPISDGRGGARRGGQCG